MSGYTLGHTEVADTFAEAFPMRYARVVITAATDAWAQEAARSMTGFATSVIGCKCEAAIERRLAAEDTPDGRPGIAVLLFAMDREGVGKRILERVGQSVMTCPTTACFDGLRRRRADGGAGEQPALLRRRLPGQQGHRWTAVLAHSGDGRRVPGLRVGRGRPGSRRREPRDRRRRRRCRFGGRTGGGRRDARGGHRAAVPRRHRAQRQQGRRPHLEDPCRPPPITRWLRRCAPRSPTRWSPTASARSSRS